MKEQIIDDSGSAFPKPETFGPSGELACGSNGMTLRQWYAGMALQGMLAWHTTQGSVESYAEWAFKHADAMIKASHE